MGERRRAALERLVPLVQNELHRIAGRCMRRERAGHTLQTTALVNEAYVRLVDVKRINWQESRALPRDVRPPDASRARRFTRERGSIRSAAAGAVKVTLVEELGGSNERPHDLVALDDALEALAKIDERKSRVIELRFFWRIERRGNGQRAGGLAGTVMRTGKLAKAWLLVS